MNKSIGILLFCSFVSAAPVSVAPLMGRAQRAHAAARFDEARNTLQRALSVASDSDERVEVERQLAEWNQEVLLSPWPQMECTFHRVESGDSIGKLATRYGTTQALIRKMNGIAGDQIRLGQKLKILTVPFRAEVDKSENTMVVLLGDRFFKRYLVTTGVYNRTPVGEWTVENRIVHPDWTRPDDGVKIPYGHPDHKIGTHWLGWDKKGFGLHGTVDPDALGTQASSGCVRLHNDDVAEVYMFFPRGTKIAVRD